MSIDWGAVAASQAGASAPTASAQSSTGGIDWKKIAQSADRSKAKVGSRLDKVVGGAIVAGHNNPYEAVMGVLGAPQRGLQALETGVDVGHAIMTPKTSTALTKAVKDKIGLSRLEAGPLAGIDLPHKVARGVLDTGLDMANDPLTFLPVGKMARIAGKAIPALGEGAERLANAARDTVPGKFLDPEADLRGLTDKGKATFEAIVNKGKEAADALGKTHDDAVRRAANEIRNGVIPDSVRKLFSDAKNIPEARPGMRPQDVAAALYKDRSAVRQKTVHSLLQATGLTNRGAKSVGRAKVTLKNPGELFNDPAKADETRALLAKLVQGDTAARPVTTSGKLAQSAGNIGKTLTHASNKAFLALPFPHGGNLTNLAYNRYGLPTALKGIGNAARVATNTVGEGSHLGKNIGELEQMGAKSQYGNIFDEMGLTGSTKIPGSRMAANAANKILIPLQKGSNKLQNVFLNPLETGLRAAALDAERKGGTTGFEAARNIHKAFGSGANNALTMTAENLGAPFAKFHAQTSLGSGLRTLATNPARIANAGKADRDLNSQINPGSSAKFHMSVPGTNVIRAIDDPLHYFASLVGPAGQLGSDYSSLTQAQKGKVGNALGAIASKYGAGSEEAQILLNIITGKKGRAGEKAVNDLPGLITGGYYQRPKP